MDATQAQSAAVPGDAAPGGTPPPAAVEAPVQATPATPSTPGGESPAVPVSAEKDKGSILVPHGAMKKLKEAERAAGAAALKADLDERAKNLGFRDMDALLEARVAEPKPKKKKAAPAAVAAAAVEIEDDEAEEADDEEEEAAPPPVKAKPAAAEVPQVTAATLAEEKKQRQRAERKVREMESKLQAQQAQAYVERALILAGAKDLDYLYARFQRETAKFTPEQAEAFDLGPWIEKRRAEQAHLFGDAIVPIDTSRGAAPAAAAKPEAAAAKLQPPKEEEEPRGSGAAVAVDPKTGQYTMSKHEKDALLQKIIRDAAGYKPPVMPQ